MLDDVYVEYYRTRARDLRAALLRDLRAVRELEPGRNRTLEWLQWVDLEIDNIRSALQKMRGCLGLAAWSGARRIGRVLLGHARDDGEHPLVR